MSLMENKDLTKLNKVLHKLEGQLEKQNSLLFNFTRGLIYGLGFILGTTILVSLLITVLSKFVDIVPFINSIFGLSPESLQNIIESQ